MTASSLDGIPGLGEARKKQLVKAMGGVNAVKRASLDELQALSFLPDAVAEAVYAKSTHRVTSSVAGTDHDLASHVSSTISASIRSSRSRRCVAVATEVAVGDDELVEAELGVAADGVDDLRRPTRRACGRRTRPFARARSRSASSVMTTSACTDVRIVAGIAALRLARLDERRPLRRRRLEVAPRVPLVGMAAVMRSIRGPAVPTRIGSGDWIGLGSAVASVIV